MEIELVIQRKKEIYSSLIDFIDNAENADFDCIIEVFEKDSIIKDKEIIITLHLLSKISDNHHCLPDFIDKLGKIIQYLIQDKKAQIPDFEIYKIFKNNKRVLLMLLEQGFIQPDQQIIEDIMETKDENNFPYKHYLYSGIKSFIDEKNMKTIESEIKKKYTKEISSFEEKCRIGENDSYICSLIRHDSVEEFIPYVNRTNISLSIQIQPSIYETNSFLINHYHYPTLIEYAAFFGSIQIIQYLKYSKVSLTSMLWPYVIHSNNAELIHFLEENGIKPQKAYDDIFKESIVCHHNSIADYIKDNFLDTTINYDFSFCIIESYNYYYYPTDIEYIICKSKSEYGFAIRRLCFPLKQITIPSSVTSIGNDAFIDCYSLTQITIPSSVTSIGNFAFSCCISLPQIIIPSSVTSIGYCAFFNCESLTQIIISSSVTEIRFSVFSHCKSLTQITIPSSVTSIGNTAFEECSSLVQITIPSSVTSIGDSAFSHCKSLTQITIPSSVTLIGDYAFSHCKSLTQITIPSSVTSIGKYAFSGCSSIAQLSIYSHTIYIREHAFEYCSSLTQVYFCSSEINLNRKDIFLKCDSLKKITFKSLSSTPYFYFNTIKFLEKVVFDSCSFTSIDYRSFYTCCSLNEINIPNTVRYIQNSAFGFCNSLVSIVIPSSVNYINNHAFNSCNNLKNIVLSDSLKRIGSYAFLNCSSLESIDIPSSVTFIGARAFKACKSLKQINIPPNVHKIRKSTFAFCINLEEVVLSSSLKSIDSFAFCKCSSLKSFKIPSSVFIMGENVFGGCTSLSQLTISRSILSENLYDIGINANKVDIIRI